MLITILYALAGIPALILSGKFLRNVLSKRIDKKHYRTHIICFLICFIIFLFSAYMIFIYK